MSRYGIDKVLRRLILDEESRAVFFKSPGELLADCDLTEAEKEHLRQRDIGALYAMGAHPFLLWNAMSFVAEEDREAFREKYLQAVKQYGSADFVT